MMGDSPVLEFRYIAQKRVVSVVGYFRAAFLRVLLNNAVLRLSYD